MTSTIIDQTYVNNPRDYVFLVSEAYVDGKYDLVIFAIGEADTAGRSWNVKHDVNSAEACIDAIIAGEEQDIAAYLDTVVKHPSDDGTTGRFDRL